MVSAISGKMYALRITRSELQRFMPSRYCRRVQPDLLWCRRFQEKCTPFGLRALNSNVSCPPWMIGNVLRLRLQMEGANPLAPPDIRCHDCHRSADARDCVPPGTPVRSLGFAIPGSLRGLPSRPPGVHYGWIMNLGFLTILAANVAGRFRVQKKSMIRSKITIWKGEVRNRGNRL